MTQPQPSPPPVRRSRRKDARPGEILAAALELFAERGFAATRLEDIAHRAGISKGTIYLYFPTKEDLFRAVVRQGIVPNLAALEALADSHTGPIVPLLRQIAARILSILQSDLAAIPKLVLTESGNFPALARFYAEEVIARGRALLSRVIVRGIEQGEFRPLDTASVVSLFFAPFLLAMLWRTSLGRQDLLPLDPNAIIELHLDLLLRGLAKERP